MYEYISKLLPVKQANIIDVGCHKGHFIQSLKQSYKGDLFTIGIDPIDYHDRIHYDLYMKMAIDNVERADYKEFNKYVEPGCNSLLKMKTKNVVHTRDKPGWFVGWNIEQEAGKEFVHCNSMKNLLSFYGWFSNIDYVKIDTQGNDINVVRSFQKYLNKVKYIQMECVSSHNKDIILYENQQILEDDIKDMYELGFEVIHIQDYSANASPEADVIFRNMNYENK